MNRLITVLLISMTLTATNAHAVSDGSGYKIIAQLGTQIKKITDLLKTTKETLDIQKQMEAYEAYKQTKRLVETAREFKQMIDDTEQLYQDFKYAKEDPFNLKAIEDDYEKMKNEVRDAEGRRGGTQKLVGYTNVMIQMGNLKTLSTMSERNKRKIGSGTDERDLAEISATNMQMLTELAIEEKKQEVKAQKTENQLLNQLLDSPTEVNTIIGGK